MNNSAFLGLLSLVFIVLKLTGEITWSWFWVLSPVWVPLVLALSVLLVAGLVLFVYNIFRKDS